MLELSESAKVILRHFRDNLIPPFMFELPDVLRGLFSEDEECARAQDELYQRGLIDLKQGEPAHIPTGHRVRPAALTLEGRKYIQESDLL